MNPILPQELMSISQGLHDALTNIPKAYLTVIVIFALLVILLAIYNLRGEQ